MLKHKKTLILLTLVTSLLASLFLIRDLENQTLDQGFRDTLYGQFVELPQGVTHYELAGDQTSPLVVLVHGFSIPSYIWDRNVNVLTQAGYRVLRFDLFGRGFSDRPSMGYTLDDYVQQINDLLTALELKEPFHLVGLSMGGAIATRYTHQHSDMVMTLSLLAPLVDTPDRIDLSLISLPLVGEYLATTVMMPKIESRLTETVYNTQSFPEWQDKLDQHIHLRGYRHALLTTARYLKGKSFVDDYALLSEKEVPTLLIWGTEDQVNSVENAEKILNAAPRTQSLLLERTGHLPQLEQHQSVNPALVKHFEQAGNDL